jgi:hypothetical protein
MLLEKYIPHNGIQNGIQNGTKFVTVDSWA